MKCYYPGCDDQATHTVQLCIEHGPMDSPTLHKWRSDLNWCCKTHANVLMHAMDPRRPVSQSEKDSEKP